jgi:hypothetical protein
MYSSIASIGTIGQTTKKIISTLYNTYVYNTSVYKYLSPTKKYQKYNINVLNGLNGITSDEISSIVENYAKIQSRRKSTDLILTLESEYYDEIIREIEQLKTMEKDDYLENWIALLEKRSLQVKQNISILENNKLLYVNVPLITGKTTKTIVSDDDEFWACTICQDNRKDTFLNCGHVFCKLCVNKLNKCPNCKVVIQKDVIKPIYL